MHFHSAKCIWKCRLELKCRPFCLGINVLTMRRLLLLHLLSNKASEPTLFYESSAEAGIFRVDMAAIIAVDALAPCFAISSAATTLNMRLNQPFCSTRKDFKSWWRHQTETFSRYWPFVRGIHRSPLNSPPKGQWRRALMFSLIYAWIHGWVNNREAGDLRRHRAHYDANSQCQ